MSSLRKNPAKIFVKVRADHLLDGSTRPLMLRSEDGPTLRIDPVSYTHLTLPTNMTV